jgi:biofilm PGA synthesis N-glycosyltransferase PgaC
VGIVLLPYFVFAAPLAPAQKLQEFGKGIFKHNPDPKSQIASTIGTVINAFLSLLGIIFIILILVSGYQYMTAGGNEEKTTKALGAIKRAIIGLIKRAQSIYGKIFAVSGVVTAFRKAAVHDVGFWSTDMSTEDIDICWRLQIRHWTIKFEPHAMCWILMPETIGGLWKQRLRWAQGGVETLFRYPHIFDYKKQRRMWPVYFEYLISISWAFSIVIVAILWLFGQALNFPLGFNNASIYGILLGITFMLQFAVSFYISSRYEKGLGKFYFWLIWYPIAYWMIIAATSVVGFIKAINRDKTKRAVWESPDRGI